MFLNISAHYQHRNHYQGAGPGEGPICGLWTEGTSGPAANWWHSDTNPLQLGNRFCMPIPQSIGTDVVSYFVWREYMLIDAKNRWTVISTSIQALYPLPCLSSVPIWVHSLGAWRMESTLRLISGLFQVPLSSMWRLIHCIWMSMPRWDLMDPTIRIISRSLVGRGQSRSSYGPNPIENANSQWTLCWTVQVEITIGNLMASSLFKIEQREHLTRKFRRCMTALVSMGQSLG